MASLIVFLLFVLADSSFALKDPCQHPIYCVGGPDSLLHTVNVAHVFNDSKRFVDKPLRSEPEVVLANFKDLMDQTGGKPSKEDLNRFLDENFDPVGTELQAWIPSDIKENPSIMSKIKNDKLKQFAKDLNAIWGKLGRKVIPKVRQFPHRYSEIYLEYPFIIPGGRFRELYYWDSYWTILGLLASNMPITVKGMLKNLIHLVERYGHIPNGNRIYYINRSQPPLFISMMKEYYEATKDLDFIRQNIVVMEQEFEFWMRNRSLSLTVKNETFTVFRYYVDVPTPRPESYFPDYAEAFRFPTEEKKKEFYKNMRSGAESGWDYSTKWFIKDKSNIGTLADTKTSLIIPVELVSYLCRNSRILANFYSLLNDIEAEAHYLQKNREIQNVLDKLLWNDEAQVWLDYDLKNHKSRNYFYPSNLAPLWAECFDDSKVEKVLNYFDNSPASKYLGGLPTSLIQSGQQWDLRNAWPPLQEIVITGLEKTGHPRAQQLAFNLAQRWINNNWLTYINSDKVMFEKYDVLKVGVPGRGGEYEVVEGFGWTNGVALHLLDVYGQRLQDPTIPFTSSASSLATSRSYLLTLFTLCIILWIVAGPRI